MRGFLIEKAYPAILSAFGGVKGRTQLPGYVEQYLNGEIKIDEMHIFMDKISEVEAKQLNNLLDKLR